MLGYYLCTLTLMLLFQTTPTSVYKNIGALFLIIISDVLLISDIDLGIAFYEATLRVEIFCFIVIFLCSKFHKSRGLLLVILLSMLWNFTYISTSSQEVKQFIEDYYGLFDIITLEYLLYYCLEDTGIYKYIKSIFNSKR